MFFTPSLNIGGIERVFITYANELCNNYDVTYVCTHYKGELKSLLKSDVNFHSLEKNRLRQSFFALVNYLKTETPDILITGGNIPNCICLFAIVFSRKNIKLIMSHHNYFNIEQNNLSSKIIIKMFYNKADAIISVSNGITHLLSNLGIKKDKIHTIYNPINIDDIIQKSQFSVIPQFNFKNNYIVSVGRLNKVKNIILMIDAFYLFHKYYNNTKLIIIGEGEEKENIKKHIKYKKMESHIILAGGTDNPYPYIYHSKLVLSTSLSEALPTVFLESFALGKTIVSTPTFGAIELLKNERNGYISNSLTTPQPFVDKMIKAYNNPIACNILKKEASIYSIENKIKELESLFNHIFTI